ncbi:unnamed protein product, partial [marine sediment metagenome]
GAYLKETVAGLGENIAITRFTRFQLGEMGSAGSGSA